MATEAKAETKYERLRKIGIGSYGVVFKCVNRQTGQIVAIKRYSENDSDPIIRKIAMREVRMLRQLKHPNLIHLIEVFRRKRILHLVFDYCELTVLDVIEKYSNNCPLNLIRKIIWQLINGVDHCHSHNCIHRDIKPENILINQSGVVKLCDFGFARNITSTTTSGNLSGTSTNSSGAKSPRRRQQQEREAQLLGVVVPTQTTTTTSGNASPDKENTYSQLVQERQALTEYVATRWYRAPELLVGDVYYDVKIDIWAIGCVTAELMRGEPLWPGKTDLDQLCMIKGSVGPLTPSQTHTLLTQGLYDQVGMERALSQAAAPLDPLERKLPGHRVGQLGMDFVLNCLKMDPSQRPTSDDLLQHAYIQSAQMSQFVRGASHQAVPSALAHQGGVESSSTTTNVNKVAVRSLEQHQLHLSRSNSQAILRAANNNRQQPPASKRLVLGPAESSGSGSSGRLHRTTDARGGCHSKAISSKTSGGGASSLVPVPTRYGAFATTSSTSGSTHRLSATSDEQQTGLGASSKQYKRRAPGCAERQSTTQLHLLSQMDQRTHTSSQLQPSRKNYDKSQQVTSKATRRALQDVQPPTVIDSSFSQQHRLMSSRTGQSDQLSGQLENFRRRSSDSLAPQQKSFGPSQRQTILDRRGMSTTNQQPVVLNEPVGRLDQHLDLHYGPLVGSNRGRAKPANSNRMPRCPPSSTTQKSPHNSSVVPSVGGANTNKTSSSSNSSSSPPLSFLPPVRPTS